MKPVKSLFVTVFILSACLSLHAQSNTHFAGENKKVVHLDDNSQQVEIGVPDPDPTHCYEWSGPNILTDPHQPVITVNPPDPTNVYTVVRHSTCGPETDEVVVSSVDTLSLVSVTPLRECYNDGDSVHLSDFDIVTDPPGYGSLATVSPQVVYHVIGAVGSSEDRELTFSLRYNDYTSTKNATVEVYNEGLSISGGHSIHIDKIFKALRTLELITSKCTEISKTLSKGGRVLPCSIELDGTLNMPSVRYFHACCNGTALQGFSISNLSYAPSIVLNCYIPIPGLKINGLGGLSAHLGLAASAILEPVTYTYKGECSELSLARIGINVEVAGGVEASLISRDILSFQLDLVGSASSSISWVIGDGIKCPGVETALSIVGSATFLSLFTQKISYKFGSHVFFNN